FLSLFLCNDTATPAIYTLSLHDALPIFGRRLDAIAGQHINQALLHEGDQFAYAQIQTPQIQHQVGHELAGTVVGHLPAALDLYHRYIAGRQEMLGLAGLPLGEHLGVLEQPDLIGSARIALTGQATHRLQRGLVVHQPEMAYDELRHYSTMWTRPVARRSSWMACNCSTPVAVISTCTERKLPLRLSRSTSVVGSRSGAWRWITSITRSENPSPAVPITLMGYRSQGNSIFGA